MRVIRPAIGATLAFTLLTGVGYTALITAIGNLVWPAQAAGSLITRHGVVAGSALIGQPFESAGYFWSRPSATSPVPYNGASSSGSNLGPLNPTLDSLVRARVARLRAADPSAPAAVPVDLVTASGSGLDPDISPGAAAYQVNRVARARGLDAAAVRALVAEHTTGRQLGLFGEPRVNVVRLNLALDSAVALTHAPAVR
jgi:K+-transporting ATPase ATPase C chain